eukprot:357886-Chlamydomonas_euryale.AAC.3
MHACGAARSADKTSAVPTWWGCSLKTAAHHAFCLRRRSPFTPSTWAQSHTCQKTEVAAREGARVRNGSHERGRSDPACALRRYPPPQPLPNLAPT